MKQEEDSKPQALNDAHGSAGTVGLPAEITRNQSDAGAAELGTNENIGSSTLIAKEGNGQTVTGEQDDNQLKIVSSQK